MNKYQWRQVAGDYGDPVTFGGIFIRDARPGRSYCDMYVIEGARLYDGEDKRVVEVCRSKKKGVYGPDAQVLYNLTIDAPILVRRLDIAWEDPLNESWVNWGDVLRFTGMVERSLTQHDMEPWARIQAVGDYYGWDNFGDGIELRACDIRQHLRRALERSRRIAAGG